MAENLPDETTQRFVAVLNKKIEVGKLMNALGHMAAGLAGGSDDSGKMHFLEYGDASDKPHPNISHFPFIVLKAKNSNQIQTLKEQALERGIEFTDFTDTMTIGTSAEQRKQTKETSDEELDYYGICLFGSTDELKEMTSKLSLFV